MNLTKYTPKLIDSEWYAKSNYIKYYDKLPIDDKKILLESQHGRGIDGNIFYIMKYLCHSEKYREYSIFLSVFSLDDEEKFKNLLEMRGLQKVSFLFVDSDEYYRIAASAKYLINDTTFLPFFSKKEGQVYLNTWHGTPLKTLGKRIIQDAVTIGNVQKNFVAADYLLCPNEYTRQHLVEDFMLENISPNTKTVLGAYPRNEIFFDDIQGKKVREELQLSDKRVYVYMPTYRGKVSEPGVQKSDAYFFYYLYELDKLLNEDEVLFLKTHSLDPNEIEFDDFAHIKSFPEAYETYEFLNIADVLVTDYSSVFFDFACTRKKVVLFPFDREDYFQTRGTYMPLEDLPFPQVFTLDELVKELRSGKKYDDTEFLHTFCPCDSRQATAELCDFVILQQKNSLEAESIPDNGKENVFIYVGDLAKNGITASIRALLNNIELDKRNYYVTFKQAIARKNQEQLKSLPAKVNYFPMASWFNLSPLQKVIRVLFERKKLSAKMYVRLLSKRLRQDIKGNYGGARIDTLIQFNGYDDDIILMYSSFKGKRYIYSHSDMIKESKTRENSRKDVTRYAYATYDKVLLVSEDIVSPMKSLLKRAKSMQICKNVIDYQNIIKLAESPIELGEKGECSISFSDLQYKLSSAAPKYINIGRFSPEKGHERLIEAFCKIRRDCPDALLFIMGGNSFYGNYKLLLQKIQEMNLTNSVILLSNISNPYPVLKACDYFVLSSFYEGFGLVLAEADVLGKPLISTDIEGPRTFMLENGGTLVENSEEGIYQGMKMLLDGKVETMHVDYEKYNKECVQEFESAIG